MLKIAVQKSGRLYTDSINLLKDCGLQIDNAKDQLKASIQNFPAEILFLRNSDIPQYVESGVADMAIIGDNVVIEKKVKIEKEIELGFSKCRLSIASPNLDNYSGIQSLQGKKIATSYPFTLQEFLDKHNLSAEIHQISGSVEIAPNIGLADAICDLVSSGNTLFKNNLTEREVLLFSQASLYVNSSSKKEKAEWIDEIKFRIESVLQAKKHDYILFNIPNDKIQEASEILPGLKSPTVTPLLTKGWSSMHSVVEKNRFWEIITALKKTGAEGILITSLSKMVS